MSILCFNFFDLLAEWLLCSSWNNNPPKNQDVWNLCFLDSIKFRIVCKPLQRSLLEQ